MANIFPVNDLSETHEPIGPIFASQSERRLSTADLDFFETHGYLAGPRLLATEHLDVLRRDLERLTEAGMESDIRFYEYNRNESTDTSRVLFHALGAWRVSPAFHDLIFFKPLISMAEQLLGGPVRFWHDQVFVKPPKDGAVVAWHQDYSYWTRTVPVAHLTCWVALDDSTVENGCVHYVPGSHRWPLLPRGELASDMNAIFAELDDEQNAAFKPVPIELRVGEVSFHHPMTVHGSFENHSQFPRRAAVVNFIRDGVLSDTDKPLLAGVPVIPRGAKIEGRFFPLVSR